MDLLLRMTQIWRHTYKREGKTYLRKGNHGTYISEWGRENMSLHKFVAYNEHTEEEKKKKYASNTLFQNENHSEQHM